jgi:hypothetical protein
MIYIYDGRDKFYQWDINQKLVIDNPDVNEVNFSTAAHSQALVCEIYELDGKRVVDVPNILLTNSWDINVYAKCDLCVRETAKFEVMERAKPDDYVYTETEIKKWEDLEARVNETLEQMEETAANVEKELNTVNKKFDDLPYLYSNALKSSRKGQDILVEDAIIGQELKVKTTCLTVSKLGKNLIDYTAFYPNGTHTTTTDAVVIHYSSVETAKNDLIPIPNYLVGKTITVSAWLKRSKPVYDRRARINIKREGGSLKGNWAGEVVNIPEETPTDYYLSEITFTAEAGDEIQIICASPGASVWIKKLMLSFSNNTSYEPYNPTVYEGITTSGTVKEIKGIKATENDTLLIGSKSTNPFYQSYVSVEYVKDINKVIRNLTNAIISMGGNV